MERRCHIVLVGGGHCNVQVMVKLATELKKRDACRITMVSDYPFAYYSGMLPACVAHLYEVEGFHLRIFLIVDIRMDLVSLCGWCKANWVQGKMIGLDRESKQVILEGQDPVPYDILSIDIGSRTLVKFR
jgi:selenide,water dikinase